MSSRLPVLGNENKYGENLDKCIVDMGIKTGSGVLVGGLFSLLLKRRAWPITLGAGIGIGMSLTTCQNRFQNSPGTKSPENPPSEEATPTIPDPTNVPDTPIDFNQSDA
uniref:MICOS complex subunit MIC10 n=1 Tax=Ciona savignyi TaxID=51511 RepID=H2YG91_CIOSA